MTPKQLTRLRRILAERFGAEELKNLCFDLDVDYEGLPGEGKAGKARELVAYLERREQIPHLLELGKQLRPDIAWEETPFDWLRISESKPRLIVAATAVVVIIAVIAIIISLSMRDSTQTAADSPSPSATGTTATSSIGSSAEPAAWPDIISIRPIWDPVGGLGQIPKIIPLTLDSQQSSARLTEQINQVIEDTGVGTWAYGPMLVFSDTETFTGAIQIILLLQSNNDNRDWIRFGKTISLGITPLSLTAPTTVDMVGKSSIGGGFEIKDFSSALLQSDFDTYSQNITNSHYDFFSLEPGEWEMFRLSFVCQTPGIYQLEVTIPYDYGAQSGKITFSDLPEAVCPQSFHLWSGDFKIREGGSNYTTDPILMAIQSAGNYTWEGAGYSLVP